MDRCAPRQDLALLEPFEMGSVQFQVALLGHCLILHQPEDVTSRFEARELTPDTGRAATMFSLEIQL